MRLLAPSLIVALACLTAALPVASAEVDECVYPALTAFACVNTSYSDSGPACEAGNPNARAYRFYGAEVSYGIVGADADAWQWCSTNQGGRIDRFLSASACVRLREQCATDAGLLWSQRTPSWEFDWGSCYMSAHVHFVFVPVLCLGHVPQPTLPRGP